jgi:hypothetical protein
VHPGVCNAQSVKVEGRLSGGIVLEDCNGLFECLGEVLLNAGMTQLLELPSITMDDGRRVK